MGPLTGKKSLLERRLKELKKESELVRDDIKALSKAVKNPDEVTVLPRLKSQRHEDRRVPAPTRKDPVSTPREPPKPEVTPGPAPTGAKGELFDWAPRAEQLSRQASGLPPKVIGQSLPEPSSGPKNKAVMKDQRFANYFSSGNFLGSRPMKQEKSVQRNKAVFMIVVVIVVAFSVFRLVVK
jgi:hypothetical protein